MLFTLADHSEKKFSELCWDEVSDLHFIWCFGILSTAVSPCLWLSCCQERCYVPLVCTSFVCLFVCLFWVFRPNREFFTHMETSPWLVKDWKFWPILRTHGWVMSSEGSLACHMDCNTGCVHAIVCACPIVLFDFLAKVYEYSHLTDWHISM